MEELIQQLLRQQTQLLRQQTLNELAIRALVSALPLDKQKEWLDMYQNLCQERMIDSVDGSPKG